MTIAHEAGRFRPDLCRAALYGPAPDHDDQLGLVMDGWKLIEHRTLGYHELYDLVRDPEERRDLSASEPQRVQHLRARLFDR